MSKKYQVPVTIHIQETITVEVSDEDCLNYKRHWEKASLHEDTAVMKALNDVRGWDWMDSSLKNADTTFEVGVPVLVEEVKGIVGPEAKTEINLERFRGCSAAYGPPGEEGFWEKIGKPSNTATGPTDDMDFLDEIVKEQTTKNPNFPQMVEEAEKRRNFKKE